MDRYSTTSRPKPLSATSRRGEEAQDFPRDLVALPEVRRVGTGPGERRVRLAGRVGADGEAPGVRTGFDFLSPLEAPRAAQGVELQAEIDRRIDELGDRRIGHHQRRGNLVEAEPDAELVFAHLQIPELVLEHDGHLIGETLAERARASDRTCPFVRDRHPYKER